MEGKGGGGGGEEEERTEEWGEVVDFVISARL